MKRALSGTAVIVTGASSGIGRATALEFARRGARVALAARNRANLEVVADRIAAEGGRALVLPTDVADRRAVQELVERTVAEFGRLDVLVNSAGVGLVGRVEELPPDLLRQVLDVNLLGPLYAIQAAAPHLRRQRGVIVNVASIVASRPVPGQVAYCLSKAALAALSRGLRMESAASGLRVITVYPGPTATDFGKHSLGDPSLRRPSARWRWRVVAPERVARRIVAAVENDAEEVYVTWLDRLTVLANGLLGPLGDRLLARRFAALQRSAGEAPRRC